MWRIYAQVTSYRIHYGETFSQTIQIPMFELNEITLGITSKTHAIKIALDILNPFSESNKTFDISAERV
jgi:hypothetical protein